MSVKETFEDELRLTIESNKEYINTITTAQLSMMLKAQLRKTGIEATTDYVNELITLCEHLASPEIPSEPKRVVEVTVKKSTRKPKEPAVYTSSSSLSHDVCDDIFNALMETYDATTISSMSNKARIEAIKNIMDAPTSANLRKSNSHCKTLADIILTLEHKNSGKKDNGEHRDAHMETYGFPMPPIADRTFWCDTQEICEKLMRAVKAMPDKFTNMEDTKAWIAFNTSVEEEKIGGVAYYLLTHK